MKHLAHDELLMGMARLMEKENELEKVEWVMEMEFVPKETMEYDQLIFYGLGNAVSSF